jgi:hypothetical protein
MPKSPKRMNDLDLDPIGELSLDISADARRLAARVAKEPCEQLGFSEPVRRAIALLPF